MLATDSVIRSAEHEPCLRFLGAAFFFGVSPSLPLTAPAPRISKILLIWRWALLTLARLVMVLNFSMSTW